MLRSHLLAMVGSAVLLTGCNSQVEPAAAPANPTSASPSAAAANLASPSPPMSPELACQQVVEGATDYAFLAAQASKDPTLESIAPGDAKAIAKKIRDTLPFLDEKTADKARELTYPLDMIYGAIVTGEQTTIELKDANDAVPDVMKGCRGKANLKNYNSPYQP